ncbi:MAG: HAMP domain-containing protein [Deltaproteobacteria bacterium]|nr:HAMP domain-containing protein [Deltaproteobacteria bacterium]
MMTHMIESVMKRMKVWQKLGFLGIVFMIPLAVVSYQMISSMRTLGIEFARKEVFGVQYLAPVRHLLEDVQQHRDMANALLSGDASFAEKLAGKKGEIDDDLQAVDAVDHKLGARLQATNRWEVLKKRITNLLGATATMKPQDSFGQHTELIADLLAFIVHIGDTSNLVLDPDIDSSYVMDLLVRKLPQLSETLSQARGLGAGIAARRSRMDEEKVKLGKLLAFIDVHLQEVDQALEKAFEFNPQLRTQLEKYRESAIGNGSTFIVTLNRQLLAAATISTPTAEYFTTATTPITVSFELAQQLSPALGGLLGARITGLSWEMYTAIIWVLVGIVVVTLIGLIVVRDVTYPLSRAVSVAAQIATGDLSVTVSTDNRRDEIGILLQGFQRMVRSLQETARVAEKIALGDLTVTVQPQSKQDTMGNVLAKLVQSLCEVTHQIQDGVNLLSATTSEILSAITQVAAGASQTASAVTETATTVEQVKQTALVASQKAKAVADSSQVAAQVSRAGEQSVEEAIGRMERMREQMESIADSVIKLGEQSRAIGEIITSVNDLADQSNLLAVNAAIEAANAGEHGKGFAVVAQEVKNLAEQSKQATAQVRTILSDIQKATNVAVMVTEQGTKAVEAGVAQSVEAGGAIRMLARNMAEAAQAVAQIAASSQQQALGMDQVVIAVESIKDASNQNVASMTQVEGSMQHLHELGQRLQQVVGRYKLNGKAA